PGAWHAGCGEYLAGLLAHDLAHLVPAYRTGLDDLDVEAHLRHDCGFAALLPEQQDEVLTDVDSGRTAHHWSLPAPQFFRMLVQHTVEGYYSDPGNGGNRDALS